MTALRKTVAHKDGWRTVRARFVMRLNRSKREVAGLSPETPVSFIPMEAVGEWGGLDTSEVRPVRDVMSGYTFFRDGDVLVAKITPCFENGKGAIAAGLAGGYGFGTTELHVLSPSPSLHSRFLFYVSISHSFRLRGQGEMYGAGGQKRVPEAFLLDFPLVLPDLGEQQTIVAFLDRKTPAIDALIAKKERLIGLLQEKRQALITQAVTKGLDPTVPIKDSGIEWLRTIPAHWTLRRLKHLGQIRSGVAKGRDLIGKATISRPYLRVANVQNGWLDLDDIASIEVTVEEAHRYKLQAGDVLMNEGGDFDKLGRGYVWEGQIPTCIHQNRVFAVRPWRGVNSYWVNLATQASYLRHFFILRSKQSTNLASISATNLGEAPVPIPPAGEIEELLRTLRQKLQRLDGLVTLVTNHIHRLREYRQALITAAVTGQLDVSAETSEAA